MNDKQNVYWSLMEKENWKFYLAATMKGLCYVGSPNAIFEELQAWVHKRFPDAKLIEDDMVLQPYRGELSEYLKGKLDSFSFALDIQGTPFQQEIWSTLNQIPYGTTFTYTQIAELVKRPAAVRAVGTAIGANPVLITVPCHRVIGKDGKLTGYRGGLEMKRFLLNLEKS